MIQIAVSVGRQVPNHMKRSYVAVVTHQRIVRSELVLQLYLDERENSVDNYLICICHVWINYKKAIKSSM